MPALLLCVFLLAGTVQASTPRVIAIDWGQAQTLIALGVPPIGMAQIETYGDWVAEPAVPASVREIGLRSQPNLELLAQLQPDVITITPMYASAEPRLARIAPVVTTRVYYGDGGAWQNTVETTRTLGELIGRAEAAERLVRDAEDTLAAEAARLPEPPPRLLVVQFVDARHVRVFGRDSLIGAVLERLGIGNAWQGSTNFWGFSVVPLERLATIDNARMTVIEPMPVGVAEALDDSVLWQHLPSVRDKRDLKLSAVWSFGGLPSAIRFARLIADALDTEPRAPGGRSAVQ